MMLFDMKEFIPVETLPRYNATKRKWLKPVKLYTTAVGGKYLVYFITRRGKGQYKISRIIPKRIDITDRFKCALTAYLCEGTNIAKAINTHSSGQKAKNIHVSNSDPWILRLIIDEFEKIGIKREQWRVLLDLFTQHNVEKEKIWWANKLNIPTERIYRVRMNEGDIKKAYREPHGRATIQTESVLLAAILYNLINLLKNNKTMTIAPK